MKFDINSYDYYIVSYSSGKDSTAVFLWLLDQGIPREKIELWHQDIDGREKTFFDWEITPDYCRRFAEAFGVKIYFQWKEGGFLREMLRKETYTAPNCFETETGEILKVGGKTGKRSTRMKYPQCSPSLSVRWCSSYLKIDVCSAALRNDERFRCKRTLVLSGERGEESPQRAKYAIFEPDKADLRNGKKYKRHIDRLRPIRDWKEEQVWEIIERYRVRAHPCYYMGWGRCSCKLCIFGNKDQFASAAVLSPAIMNRAIRLEKECGCTMKRNIDLPRLISEGKAYSHITEQLKTLATNYNYDHPIFFPDSEKWILPAGAFSKQCGPS